MTDANVVENGKATSGRSVDTIYFDANGKETARPTPDVQAIAKRFRSSGHEERLDLGSLSKEILLQAAAFGLHQAGQNAYGGATDDDEKIEKLSNRWASFLDGEWSTDRQVGPRTTDLLEAYAAAWSEKNGGKEPSQEWLDSKREMLADKVVAAEMQKKPQIRKHLDRIKMERMIARSKKSAAEADKADDDSFLD